MSENEMFTVTIEPDASWAPMQIADVLEKDGVYAGVIVGEKLTAPDAQKRGVWLTIELTDPDVVGKRLQKLLIDPKSTDKNVGFLWRGLAMSIGGLDFARKGFQYQLGAFKGQTCYFKVETYLTGKGDAASGVNDWLVKDDHTQAVAKGAHRWAPKMSGKSGDAGAFGLPTGLPTGFGAPVAQAAAPPVSVPTSATTALPLTFTPPAGTAVVPQPQPNGFPGFPGMGK